MAGRTYELLDSGACRQLLELGHVGRIAVSIGALPAIVPVTYVVDGDSVVFRPATGGGFGNSSGTVMAFESGFIDPAGEGGWSVMAVGVAEEVSDPAVRIRMAVRGDHPWVLAEDDRLYRIPLEMVSGTRIVSDVGSASR